MICIMTVYDGQGDGRETDGGVWEVKDEEWDLHVIRERRT